MSGQTSLPILRPIRTEIEGTITTRYLQDGWIMDGDGTTAKVTAIGPFSGADYRAQYSVLFSYEPVYRAGAVVFPDLESGLAAGRAFVAGWQTRDRARRER